MHLRVAIRGEERTNLADRAQTCLGGKVEELRSPERDDDEARMEDGEDIEDDCERIDVMLQSMHIFRLKHPQS